MKLRVVPALRGWHWARMGLQLGLRQPFALMSLLGLFVTAAMLMMVVPILGPIVIVAAMPVVWMGFMLATQRLLHDERITPGVMIEAVREPERRKAWLQLGGLYVGATVLVMVIAGLIGPDLQALGQAVEEVEAGRDALDNPAVVSSLLWRFALAVPMSLLFWHTPALVHWARVPPLKALFFSAVASWRNLGAFVVYGACWVGVVLALGVPLQVLAAVIPEPTIVNIVAVVAGMWVVACFYASLYFSVIECFEQPGQGDSPDDLTPPSAE